MKSLWSELFIDWVNATNDCRLNECLYARLEKGIIDAFALAIAEAAACVTGARRRYLMWAE